MDWLNGYVGRLTVDANSQTPPIDYSYVFGTHAHAQRHDPHVHAQRTRQEPDLLRLAELIRDRSAVTTA